MSEHVPDDQPKSEAAPEQQAAPSEAAPANAAPTAPTDAAPADDPASPIASPASRLTADPLSDGTVPTVLDKGGAPSHDIPDTPGKKGRSLVSVYRRADIMTTLFTFVGALVAAGIIFGGYLYFTRPKHVTTQAPTVTKLDSGDLTKLGNFFNTDNTGGASQVLTVNSSALFKSRVALNSDLKVLGGASVGGPTTLSSLTVDAASTLGVTNVRGALTVAGPLSLQSPATLGAGGTVTGNFTVSGNGSFGGAVSAGLMNITNLQVLGTLTLSGHLIVNGAATTASVNEGAGAGATATVDGNDTSGTVTITTGNIPGAPGTGQQLVQVNFHTAYAKVPHVIISPIGSNAGSLGFYVQKSGPFFLIGTTSNARSNTAYTFDYWVVQ